MLLFLSSQGYSKETTSFDIQSLKDKITYENLNKAYELDDAKVKKLDRVLNIYVEVVNETIEFLKKKKENNESLSEKESDFLIYIVEQTEMFSEKFDGGNLHHYIFSKLYEVNPQQMSLAIERSNLTASEKEVLKESIKANLRD